MSVEISPPFRVFTDVDGEPLEDGYIHIGAVNQNPLAVPVAVYWDEALTIPAAQPIRTLGGYPSRSGTPSRMYVAGDAYSIAVSNRNGTLVYSDLDNQAGDAGLRQDLAAATGAALVGTTDYATLQENLDALSMSDFVTPEQFGAIPGESADNSVAVQAAITYAQDNGGFLWFPRKYSVGSTTMEQSKRLTVRGVGKYNCGIIYGGSGAAWHCTPPFAGASNTDWSWQGIGITPATPGGGTYGLHIQLQAAVLPAVCFLADSKVTDCFIGDFGQQGLYLDNSVANTDGFFTSQYMFNTITNGILGANVGDSLNFSHNKIYGKNCGVQMTGVAGARQMIIDDNNITTHGGLITLISVEEATIRDCQLEHPGYLSGYTGIFGAGVVLFNCYKPRFEGNTLNPDNGAATAPVDPGLVATALALTGNTSSCFITQNDIQKGSVDNIAVGAPTVINTVIDDLNSYYGVAPVITDAGTGTQGLLKPATLATWTSIVDPANGFAPGFTKSQDGLVTLRGNLAGAASTAGQTLYTLPVGYRPTLKVHSFQAYAPGAASQQAVMQILPTGELQFVTVGATAVYLDGICFSTKP